DGAGFDKGYESTIPGGTKVPLGMSLRPSPVRGGGGLVRIQGQVRGSLLLEERLGIFPGVLLERQRGLIEVEHIRHAVRALVRSAEAPEIPHLFDELNDAAELILRM